MTSKRDITLILVVIIFFTVSLSLAQSPPNVQQYPSNDQTRINYAIALTASLDYKIISIQSLLESNNVGDNDIRYRILDNLKKTVEIAKQDQESIQSYLSLGNEIEAIRSAEEVIRKSEGLDSFLCMFQLDFAKDRTKSLDQTKRVSSFWLQSPNEEFRELSSKIDVLLPSDYKIDLNASYSEIKTYKKYNEECSSLLVRLNAINEDIQESTDKLPLTVFILGLSFSYLYIVAKHILGIKEFGRIDSDKLENIFFIMAIVIGVVWALIYVEEESLLGRSILGGVLGIIFYISYKSILEKYRANITGISEEERGTPLKELQIPEDYISLLNDDGIYTLEGLLEKDISDFLDSGGIGYSGGSGLSIETIIELREKSKEILSKQKEVSQGS